jgi:hypothetical protein
VVGQSHIATDGRSVSMSWCRALSRTHYQRFVNCLTVMALSYSGALSDEWSGLSFVNNSLSLCQYVMIGEFRSPAISMLLHATRLVPMPHGMF